MYSQEGDIMGYKDDVKLIKALADENRLAILELSLIHISEPTRPY